MGTIIASKNAVHVQDTFPEHEIYWIEEQSYVYKSISSHPDIFLFNYRNKIICEPRILSKIDAIKGAIVETGDQHLGSVYPDNVAYNGIFFGDTLVGNMNLLSKKVKAIFEKHIQVNQGYTNCSIVKVNEQALITSDAGIAKVMLSHGFDVLTVSVGHVKLEGFEYGFLGGTTGEIDGKLFFYGDLDLHPDGVSIRKFIQAYDRDVVELKGLALEDHGGFFYIA